MQEEARAGGAGLALPDEAHSGDDAVDDPILVGVGIDDRRTFAAELEPAQEQTEVVTGTAFMRLSSRPLRRRPDKKGPAQPPMSRVPAAFVHMP